MTWLHTLVGIAVLCGAAGAAAHATLLDSAPADGASVREAPNEIVLRFDEPVAPLAMRLVDSVGSSLALPGAARAQGTTVRIPLPGIRQGAFIFSYRVASADTHPVAGSIAFTVGEGATPLPRAGAADQLVSSPDARATLARAVRDLLVLVAGGAALFVVCIGAFPRQRAVLSMAGVAAAVASVVELGTQGAVLLGSTAPWIDALQAAAGTTAGASSTGIAVGVMAIVLGGWIAGSRLRRTLLLLGGLTAPASVALTGHAASAQPDWLSMTILAFHALAAAFWMGSLVALRLMARLDAVAWARALRRFSLFAVPAVVVLLTAGVAFASMQVDSVQELARSRYGQLVLLKASLLAVLLAIAACNRFVMTPRLERGDASRRVGLARLITAELGIVVMVITVTAILSRTPPPADAAVSKELSGTDRYRGSLAVSPGRAGRNSIVVTLRDRNGHPLDPDETRLRLGNPGAGIEPIERPMTREAAGRFRYEGSELAFPGTWTLSVEGRVGEFDRFRLQAAVEIR